MTQSALAFSPAHPPTSACRSPNGGPVACREALHARFAERIVVDYDLSRRLVSYQGNKAAPGFRWMKYKEGFSAQLVKRLLTGSGPGAVLDPFSGIGTTALTASRTGRRATGVEIMPVGNLMAKAITAIANGLGQSQFASASAGLLDSVANGRPDPKHAFPHVRITKGAFSPQAEEDIAKARQYIAATADRDLATVLNAACVAAIEEVSYTRKDGQYLRWDPRSGRTASTRLDKGRLPTLAEALKRRLSQITEDVPAVKQNYAGPPPRLIDGSCLTELKGLESGAFDAVITSPPYANRYDYTRTYALELAYLGYDETAFKTLRQALLSATVESRSKRDELRAVYGNSNGISRLFTLVDENAALNEVLNILREHAGNSATATSFACSNTTSPKWRW